MLCRVMSLCTASSFEGLAVAGLARSGCMMLVAGLAAARVVLELASRRNCSAAVLFVQTWEGLELLEAEGPEDTAAVSTFLSFLVEQTRGALFAGMPI